MTPKSETVRFIFPKDPELAVYAVAAVQGYAALYDKAYERQLLWPQTPEAARTLRIAVHCDVEVYRLFRDSFSENAFFATEFDKDYPDEMLVVLNEDRVNAFELLSSYSTQWVMGLLAGTAPRMYPELTVTTRADTVVIDRRYANALIEHLGVFSHQQAVFVDTKTLTLDQAYKLAQIATLIVAPQSALTVLGVAMKKRVVEITQSASARPFQPLPYYVQVSRLLLTAYFHDSLKRGVEWLSMMSKTQSTVPTADAPSVAPAQH